MFQMIMKGMLWWELPNQLKSGSCKQWNGWLYWCTAVVLAVAQES